MPDTEVPWALLGEIYFAGENWNAAKQAFAQSVTIKPGFENQHNLGSALYQLGQFSEAAFYYWRAHEMRNEAYRYLSLYNYVQCQLQLGCYPDREIAELERALADPLSEVAVEEMAGIYYQRNQFANVVDAYADTKLVISPRWILPYYYSLLQCNLAEIAAVLKDKVMNHTAEQRRESEEDDDAEFTWEERQNYLAEMDADKQKYLEGFAAIEASGYRPQFTFEPGMEAKCHLFGCLRHANANYAG
ncbi:Tetratricopeptide repeat protein [compost metagenome]